jgi:hypothetical protein
MNISQKDEFRYIYAGLAMLGILASPVVEGVDPNPSVEEVVRHSVTLADALIQELDKADLTRRRMKDE